MTDAAVAAPVAPSLTPSSTPSPTPATGVEGQGASASATLPVPTSDAKPEPKSDTSTINDAPKDAPKDGAVDAAKPEAPLEYNFKLPDGAKEDPELMGQFKELAKAEKLSPEMAQKIVDFAPKLGERIAQANQQAWQEMVTGWQDQVKSDPEIGGKNLDATLSSISKAIDTYAPKDKEALLNAFRLTGAGSEPNIVKFIARLSKQVGEPSYVPGGGGVQKKIGGAQALYPSMADKAS